MDDSWIDDLEEELEGDLDDDLEEEEEEEWELDSGGVLRSPRKAKLIKRYEQLELRLRRLLDEIEAIERALTPQSAKDLAAMDDAAADEVDELHQK